MYEAWWITLILFVVVVAFGALEAWSHRRALRSIKYRIHVNGTRGKTSVTRLIAAGLRAGGIRTCAKTTGTTAAVTMPDGREYPVYRPAQPNVIEQVRIVRTVAAEEAEALVIECMALQPYLQSLCEFKMVRATHGVITNNREDHLDVMGPSERHVALALAGMTPSNGVMYTGARRHLDILKHACTDRDSKLIAVEPGDVEAVTDEEMRRFRYREHKENVALALRICADLGVDRETALGGMTGLAPEAGAMMIHQVDFFGREIVFVNGFAANDPESTESIWRSCLEDWPEAKRKIALFNCRLDRPDRSRQFGLCLHEWPAADIYMLMGAGTHILAREAIRKGLDPGKLVLAEGQSTGELVETLLGCIDRSALVVGMGNIHGGGLELAAFFRNRAKVTEAA